MNEREERGPWYLLTGLIIGIVLGLLYAWVISPVEYIDTEPNTLSEEYKERQRALIARAYLATGSIGRARGRLELLEDDDLYGALTAQAQAALRDGSDPEDARALGLLSVAIGQSDTASSPLLPELPSPLPTDSIPTTAPAATAAPAAAAAPTVVNTPLLASPAGTQPAPAAALSPSPTPPPTATLQPTATRAFTATPGAPFALKEREAMCDPRLPRPMLQVFPWMPPAGRWRGWRSS
jgi:hypothetical protein